MPLYFFEHVATENPGLPWHNIMVHLFNEWSGASIQEYSAHLGEYSRQRGRVFAYCVSILFLGVVASLPTTVRSYVDPCLVARVARLRSSQLCHFWSQVLAVLTVAGHGYHINSIDPIFQLWLICLYCTIVAYYMYM